MPCPRPALPRAAAVLAALLASAGCATMRGDPQVRRLEAALDAAPIERPLDEIWAEVRRLLSDRRYPLTGKDAEAVGQDRLNPVIEIFSVARESVPTPQGGRLLKTGWARGQVRYLVEARPAGTGWLVRFTLVQEDTTEHGHDGPARRDADAELELLRRLSPERAAAVLTQAEGRPATTPTPTP